jgi:hypothetical protein
MTPSQAAQRVGVGCVRCAAQPTGLPVALAGVGVGDLRSKWERVPMWLKIAGGTVMFVGVSYGVYRLVR